MLIKPEIAEYLLAGPKTYVDLARKSGASRFEASTREVYGEPTAHPQAECYCGRVYPTGPIVCDDEGNSPAEALCFDYCRTYDLHIEGLRPRVNSADGRVASNFIVASLDGLPLDCKLGLQTAVAAE